MRLLFTFTNTRTIFYTDLTVLVSQVSVKEIWGGKFKKLNRKRFYSDLRNFDEVFN